MLLKPNTVPKTLHPVVSHDPQTPLLMQIADYVPTLPKDFPTGIAKSRQATLEMLRDNLRLANHSAATTRDTCVSSPTSQTKMWQVFGRMTFGSTCLTF